LRIVLDTNIFISAALLGRVCEEIIKFCRFGKVDVFISRDIIREIEDKLRSKFLWNNNQIRIFIDSILEFCHLIEVNEKIIFVKDDPDDDKILECAVTAKCDYIISGDRHLIKLGAYKNIKILRPADFLFLIRK